MKKIFAVLMLLCFISMGAFAQVTFASDSTVNAGYDISDNAFTLGACPNGSMTIKSGPMTFITTANLSINFLDITAFGWNVSQKVDYKSGVFEMFVTPKIETGFILSLSSGVNFTGIPHTTLSLGYSNPNLVTTDFGGLSACAEFVF